MTDTYIVIDRVKGSIQIKRNQQSCRTSVDSMAMENIVESEIESSFSGVVWSVGRLERAEVGAGIDVG